MVAALLQNITEKKITVGIVGLGYVGLPLAREFLKAGFPVLGFDTDSAKVEMLARGESYLKHVDGEFIQRYVSSSKFQTTSDPERLREADAILICVPTPLGKHREPDLSYVLGSTKTLSTILRAGQVIVLESTTYPGTTEEEMLPILEETGLKVGEDFFLGYSPEREDPGNKHFSTGTIPKVVSGITEKCLEVVKTLYDQVVVTVPVSSTRVAESTKILENTYRAVNIALVNELKVVFERMGIDIWEVIEAAKTKPFGFQAFYPGPGLGGHCIPIDPFYLTWKAREYGIHTRFIELAGEINTHAPYHVVEKAKTALNERGVSVKGAHVLILGVAYKPDIDDYRESPAFTIIDLLEQAGAVVDYHDPYIPELKKTRKYAFRKTSKPLTPEGLRGYHCAIVVTDHSNVDYDLVLRNVPVVVDTRNVLSEFAQEGVIKA
ncbi:MAG: nucleotide sugar dehydrogenase [Candidatus Latescibacterota bacterium]